MMFVLLKKNNNACEWYKGQATVKPPCEWFDVRTTVKTYGKQSAAKLTTAELNPWYTEIVKLCSVSI